MYFGKIALSLCLILLPVSAWAGGKAFENCCGYTEGDQNSSREECEKNRDEIPLNFKKESIHDVKKIVSHFSDQPTMGFEVETSCFKINIGDEKQERIGFKIKDKNNGFSWQIEDDTLDKSTGGHDRNLELKTLDGLNEK